MNVHPPSNGLTRRSFIKRSVVAAVAVSSMTIFSGLVNAQNFEPYVGDDGSCVFAQSPDFAGSCSYTDLTTKYFACSGQIACCYHMMICNGKEAVGMAWQCSEEDIQVCLTYENGTPPSNLPYCQPLG
jgi:hypothetical protein